MGVPSFYRRLVSKYPNIVCKANERVSGDAVEVDSSSPNNGIMQFDNLYLDMKGIMHPCFHPDDIGNEYQLVSVAYLSRLSTYTLHRCIMHLDRY